MVGWLVGWLVCSLVANTVFSKTALRIYLIFYIKSGDYKGRKVTERDFWKKFLSLKYSRKDLQLTPKSDSLIFFSKTALTIFLVFRLKLILNITKTIWKKNCNLEIFNLEIVKKLSKLRFLAIFSTLHH